MSLVSKTKVPPLYRAVPGSIHYFHFMNYVTNQTNN